MAEPKLPYYERFEVGLSGPGLVSVEIEMEQIDGVLYALVSYGSDWLRFTVKDWSHIAQSIDRHTPKHI